MIQIYQFDADLCRMAWGLISWWRCDAFLPVCVCVWVCCMWLILNRKHMPHHASREMVAAGAVIWYFWSVLSPPSYYDTVIILCTEQPLIHLSPCYFWASSFLLLILFYTGYLVNTHLTSRAQSMFIRMIRRRILLNTRCQRMWVKQTARSIGKQKRTRLQLYTYPWSQVRTVNAKSIHTAKIICWLIGMIILHDKEAETRIELKKRLIVPKAAHTQALILSLSALVCSGKKTNIWLIGFSWPW